MSGTGGSAIVPADALRAGELPPAATDAPAAARVAAAERSLRALSERLGGRPSDRQQARRHLPGCSGPAPR